MASNVDPKSTADGGQPARSPEPKDLQDAIPTVSGLLPCVSDSEITNLRRAARILAHGAIRAAMRQADADEQGGA